MTHSETAPHSTSPPTRSDPTGVTLVAAAGLTPVDALRALHTRVSGLGSAEAAARLTAVGPNVLAERNVTALGVMVRQLRNPLLVLLVAAAGVSALTGDVTDGGIIAAIVALSIGLGFVNEYRSELAVHELHSRIVHEAAVWRDGVPRSVDVRALVPGDIVDLQVGDLVPADLRLLETNHLECGEAVLTGESSGVTKSAEAVDTGAPRGSRTDLEGCAFMGTVVHQGSARGVVVATGSRTAFGAIATGLSEGQTDTAFQSGLRSFSKMLVGVAAALTISIFVINVVLARPLIESLLFSLAIAIGITPQLLPAIVSVSLSAGSRSLARRKVLVKRLVVIEDLGNIEVLFTDKTGTLTEGTLAFAASLDAAGRASDLALLYGLVCNEATNTPVGPVGGNALDRALWTAAADHPDLVAGDHTDPSAFHRLALVPFDHDRQRVSVLVAEAPRGQNPSPIPEQQIITKGAPEAVLELCTDVPDTVHAVLEGLFADGARVVAVASRRTEGLSSIDAGDERDLTLVGLLAFVDPPKHDAGQAIQRLHALGIDVKIITGDNGTVARKVCAEIGVEVSGTLNGADLDELSDDDLAAALPGTTVFARVSPDQKSRIVKLARRGGKDIGFLGDGVNDAVALHAADVGISVQTATDVAKDAADIVLLDKDLGVLADGVAEGRRIFANTLKYVLMATSSNFGNMFSAAGASLFLGFLPMLPSQILLNNLLYDIGQLAIPTDRVDPEVTARPAAWDIAFVRRFMATFGPISSIFDFVTFFVMLHVLHASHSEFRSGWFVESLATQTLVVYLIRTRRVPFFRSRASTAMVIIPVSCAAVGAVLPFTPLADVLGFTALPIRFFLILSAMVIVYLLLVETAKVRFYARQPHPARTPLSADQRHHRRVVRRAGRFTVATAGRRAPTPQRRRRHAASRHVAQHPQSRARRRTT